MSYVTMNNKIYSGIKSYFSLFNKHKRKIVMLCLYPRYNDSLEEKVYL
jgi:hypothetical protein